MTGVPDQPAPIESVDRALRLVELLRDEDAVSLTEAAERLDVPPSTAHRLLAALMHRDFAVRDGRLYRAGPALVVRREEPVTVQGLRDVFLPALELLHGRVQETAQLLAWEGKDTRFVVGIEPDRPLRVTARSGDHMPAYVSSGGKALLAVMDDAEVEALYDRGLPPWPTGRIKDVGELKKQLAKVRKQGYGTNFEETEVGVCGIGVAVCGSGGRGLAALVVAVPSARFAKRDVPRYLEALREARELAVDSLPTTW